MQEFNIFQNTSLQYCYIFNIRNMLEMDTSYYCLKKGYLKWSYLDWKIRSFR